MGTPIKESAIYLAAITSNLTAYNKIKGMEGVVISDEALDAAAMEEMRRNSMKEENKILGLMLRKRQALPLKILPNYKNGKAFSIKKCMEQR